LQGIESKLTYLKELSIDAIYLNPIYKSISNHRYDVATYLEIDEMLGTLEGFRYFINACHDKNIKVILDVSWNHVGADSIYFNKYKTYGKYGAYNYINSAYRDWFDIHEDGSYNSWWGIDTLPVLNKNNPSFKFHVSQVVEHWASQGIDGFRLDVIDELPDEFLEWFRVIVKGVNSDLVIIGEVWDDASMKKDCNGRPRSYLYGQNQDSVMNYQLRNLLIDFLAYGWGEREIIHSNIDAEIFYRKYMNLYNNYPKEIFYGLMNFISTHDINRIILMFGESPYNGDLTKQEQKAYILSKQKYELAIKRFKIAWSFIICSIGTPCLFYGDESGIYGYNDPFNRKPMNWGNEDMELLNWVKEINQMRTKYNALREGEMNFLFAQGDVIVFERYNEVSRLIYVANRSSEPKKIILENLTIEIEPISYKIIT
jgi:4-alpha-glucanotransferase